VKIIFTILLGVAAAVVSASEIPPSVIPEGVGINIHFVRGQKKDLDMIQAAGFKWIRMDFAWEGIEKTKGVYDWSDYDELTENLRKHHLSAIYILDYSNPLYEGKVGNDIASPQHPESIEAYSKWAAAAAAHYRGKHIIWEIWNEPNGGFWKPGPNASQYSALAVSAAAAIRKADPKATIAGPACAMFDWPFLETFLQSGVLQNIDAITMHPYRGFQLGPETAGPEYERLRGLIEKYAPEGKKKMPILSGEWGYATQKGRTPPETQAAYAVRQQLFNLLSGVPLSIWYDWKNDGPDAGYNEHNFGTVSNDLSLKPAYTALKTLTHELEGYTFKERIAPQDDDYVLLFTDGDRRKIAAWTTGKTHQAFIKFGSFRGVTAVDGMGKSFAPHPINGQVVINLEPLPKYVGTR
jgi:polysaccharide biosynthesis protein PslG